MLLLLAAVLLATVGAGVLQARLDPPPLRSLAAKLTAAGGVTIVAAVLLAAGLVTTQAVREQRRELDQARTFFDRQVRDHATTMARNLALATSILMEGAESETGADPLGQLMLASHFSEDVGFIQVLDPDGQVTHSEQEVLFRDRDEALAHSPGPEVAARVHRRTIHVSRTRTAGGAYVEALVPVFVRGVHAGALRLGVPELAMGIGVHSGEAVAGNIGSEKRIKYGVVGETVNLTGRIEGLTVGGQILVSGTTRAALGDDADVSGPEQVQVKGRTEPVEIWELHGFVDLDGSMRLVPEPRAHKTVEVRLDAGWSLVSGKTVDAGHNEGMIVRLTLAGATLQPGETGPTRALRRRDDLMIRIKLPDGWTRDLYAKVVEVSVEGADLRFTSVPEGDRLQLAALIDRTADERDQQAIRPEESGPRMPPPHPPWRPDRAIDRHQSPETRTRRVG